jgi:hypothetical protein
MKRVVASAASMLAALQVGALGFSPSIATAGVASLNQETPVYLALDEEVSSEGSGDSVGTIVRCRVWRDVENRGVVYIKAGTSAMCRVDKVARHHVGGFQGKVSITAVETKAVDGQDVDLAGGYGREGADHKAVVLGVGLLLFWPALFFSGGNADLPPGTVFSSYTVNDLTLQSEAVDDQPRMVDLRSVGGGGLTAQFMLDDFMAQPKHDVFRVKVTHDDNIPAGLVIDNINGKSIAPIPLRVENITARGGQASAVGEAATKAVARYFVRGINRFDVAYTDRGERHATEVIMNVQM